MTIKINLSEYRPQPEWYSMQTTAKVLNRKKMGRTNLMRFLRDQKILTDQNEPYQRFIDQGYFLLILKDIYNGHGAMIGCPSVSLVSEKGINFIKKLFEKEEKNGEQ